MAIRRAFVEDGESLDDSKAKIAEAAKQTREIFGAKIHNYLGFSISGFKGGCFILYKLDDLCIFEIIINFKR